MPYAAGAGADIEIRGFANFLQQRLGQSFVIDNRPGSGTLIGTEIVARAPNDGYTLLYTTGSLSTMPTLYKATSFDPLKDFEFITILSSFATVLGVNKTVPVNTLPELIAYAKANPGKLNYASTSRGVIYMGIEALKREAGINLVEIPYNGGQSQYMQALLANEVQFAMASLSGVKQFVDNGEYKVLAAIAPKRHPQLPNVPTVDELGFKTVISSPWSGLLAPKGTPKAIVDKLAAEAKEYIKSDEILNRVKTQVYIPVASTPEEFRATVEREIPTWKKVAEIVGVQPE